MSPTPKYARRTVIIDPRLSFPPGIAGVEVDGNSNVSTDGSSVNNAYTGGVTRDDRDVNPNGPVLAPGNTAPVTSGVNPWGKGTLISQELVINGNGKIVVELTFNLPDWPGDYEERVARV
jgi:hypothetical protein